MSIMLYEHNKHAYASAISMLKETGKAAVVHPTGTGKSFIGFKLCEDNPDKTICWLSPSKYIFSTQLENLVSEHDLSDARNEMKVSTSHKELSERLNRIFPNIKFFTYAKLMNMTEGELRDIHPDYIVLDEFHRCGAEQWGRGVDRLLQIYGEVPVLGLSATSIRYLDNQRDMSDEIFDGHIASEMSLGEAIVRGILNPPKYVLSVFSFKEELDRYEMRAAHAKNKAVRDKAEEYLEKLRRALNRAEGLDQIFSRHMPDRCGKYIVFCSNYEAMQDAIRKVPEWFCLIDPEPHIYQVYSEDADSVEEFNSFRQDTDSDKLRLLFCIDALNEGVHVDDISGVILLRPTISPIVYKQQIGRALSASKRTEPVVFDVVNNIKSLYCIDGIKEEMQSTISYLHHIHDDNEIVNDSFEIIDELSNCLELFNGLEETLSASWDIMYLEAESYYKTFGNLMVPADYMTEAGYGLGRWIRAQRIAREKREAVSLEKVSFDENIGEEVLSDERIRKLDKIGMCWDSVYKERWAVNYKLAGEYFKKFGDLNIPHDYIAEAEKLKTVFPDGKAKLGVWLSVQRTNYQRGHLSKEKIEALEKIGIRWDIFDDRWEQGFYYAKKYVEEVGDINFISKDEEYSGFNLSRWLHTQRARYKNGKLSKERVERLESIGFKWSIHEAFWEKGYNHAVDYAEKHGNLSVPQDFICEDGFKLKIWLKNQSSKYKKGQLSTVQITKLQGIGCI